MKKFGTTKCKVLSKLTEAYVSGDKKTVKDIISLIKENKEFKELYLLYEDIENKYFADKETAESYVIELGRSLNGKITKVTETLNKLEEMIGNVETKYISTYDNLDSLLQEDNLLNIETKVRAKIDLFKHLVQKKTITESKSVNFSTNEKLLYSVLANNFNVLYENILSEKDKEDFKNIMNLSDDDIKLKTKELKESILTKIDSLLKESSEEELINKLNSAKQKVNETNESRYNYFKLVELEKGF